MILDNQVEIIVVEDVGASISLKETVKRFFVSVLSDELAFFLKLMEQSVRVMMSDVLVERCGLYPPNILGRGVN